MTEQEELLEKIGEILNRLEIPYVITGGIAVTVWGHPRFTADIDVAIDLLPSKLDDLAEELLKIDKEVYVDRQMMRYALERHGEFNFIHPGAGLKVDFWVLKNTPFDREELRRRVKRRIGKVSISLISPEDLILRKLLWYRESESDRQLDDIQSVIRRQKKLDRKYLKRWSKIHGTEEVLKELWEKTKTT